MQPVVPRLAPHPKQVRIAPAPHAATPLLGASAHVSTEAAEPAAWAGMGSAMRGAAWRFAATCTLGAGAACTLARYYHDRGPLVVGLPLTAVTALGVTSWRLSRDPAPRDLEQGLYVAASPAAAAARADWRPAAGADVVWIAAPAEALSRVYEARQPLSVEAAERAKPYTRAQARHVAHVGAARLRPQHLGKHQHRARVDARKRSVAGRQKTRPEPTMTPAPFVFSAHATAPAAALPARSEQTRVSAGVQRIPNAPKKSACVFSQSLPNHLWPKPTEPSGSAKKLAQSELGPQGMRATGATSVALQLAQTKALAQALQDLSISGTKAWMRDANDNGLIMPTPRQDTAMPFHGANDEDSSLSEFSDVSCGSSPVSNTTPLMPSPPSD